MTLDETRERLIRLESQVEHMTATQEAMQRKVDAMHDMLMQARGARWMIVGIASLGGFALANIGKLLPIWPVK